MAHTWGVLRGFPGLSAVLFSLWTSWFLWFLSVFHFLEHWMLRHSTQVPSTLQHLHLQSCIEVRALGTWTVFWLLASMLSDHLPGLLLPLGTATRYCIAEGSVLVHLSHCKKGTCPAPGQPSPEINPVTTLSLFCHTPRDPLFLLLLPP